MANDIVPVDTPEAPSASAPEAAEVPKYTPHDHEKASGLKAVRTVELGDGPHGKTVMLEFEGGFLRNVDVDCKNIWHELFCTLQRREFQRLQDHVAPRRVLADGTRAIQDGPMWFWTTRTTARGRHLEGNYFDLPEEAWAKGSLTGAMAARELILFLREYEPARPEKGGHWKLGGHVQQCLAQAFALTGMPRNSGKRSAAHAANRFCEIVASYFAAGAATANPAYLDGCVERDEYWMKAEEDQAERARQETVDRMRELREIKAAKRRQSHTEGLPTQANTTRANAATGHDSSRTLQ
ncbi:hypothetical protein [Roseateles sp. P5_E4]